MISVQDLTEISLNSLDDGCVALGRILGLEVPVELSVLIGALRSEEYANNLLTCRNTPALLKSLLHSPPEYDIYKADSGQSTATLLVQASVSIAKWAKMGFTVADDEVITTRRKACLACPYLRATPDKIAYKMINTKAICNLCGCDIENKSRLNSESCPSEDPNNSGYNRWGQKYVSK